MGVTSSFLYNDLKFLNLWMDLMDVKNILILGHWTFKWERGFRNQCEANPHFCSQVSIENANFNCNISSSICDFCHIFLNNSFSMRYLKSNDSVKINISSVVEADTSYTQNCRFTHSRGGIRDLFYFLLLIISTFLEQEGIIEIQGATPRKFICMLFVL